MSRFDCCLIGTGSLLQEGARILLERGHQISGLITEDAAVSRWAAENGIRRYLLKEYKSVLLSAKIDFLFSIVNEKIIEEEILRVPRRYAVNYHDAPLPRYGGSFATSWALLNGEESHAITWHIMSGKVDGGDILKQCRFPVSPTDTAFTLNARCYEAALQGFRELIAELEEGTEQRKPQAETERTFFGRDKRPENNGIISWLMPAAEIHSLIRALHFGPYENPFATAKIWLGDELVIVQKSRILPGESVQAPGSIVEVSSDEIIVATISKDIALSDLTNVTGASLCPRSLCERNKLSIGMEMPEWETTLETSESSVEQIAHSERYWVKRLSDLVIPVLPCGKEKRSETRSEKIAYAAVDLPKEWKERMHSGENLEDELLAALGAYLWRLGNPSEFDLAYMIRSNGNSVLASGEVPVRMRFNTSDRFQDVVNRVKEEFKRVARHKTFFMDVWTRYPLLRERCRKSEQPLLPIGFSAQSESLELRSPLLKFALMILPEKSDCFWVFNEEWISRSEMEDWERQFAAFLERIVRASDTELVRMPLLSGRDYTEIVFNWNQTQKEFSHEKRIHEIFEQQVGQRGENTAVICGRKAWTYSEINAKANQIAYHLRSVGVRPGIPVGVLIDRSVEMVAALLGILKAGGYYVPLETSYPQKRIQYIFDSLQIRHAIGFELQETQIRQVSPRTLEHFLILDQSDSKSGQPMGSYKVWKSETLSCHPKSNLPNDGSSQDLAYVIFTSGSTGTPKGVMVRHEPVINLIEWMNRTFDIRESDRVLAVASLCFDLSVYDIFGVLAAGGVVRIATSEDTKNPERLLQILAKEPITLWNSAPAALQQILPFLTKESDAPALRLVFLSGDWIPLWTPEHLKAAFPKVEVISLGGATEATVWSNYYRCEKRDPAWVSIPYGKPIQNARYFILDGYLNPCPIGVAGDLYIGGLCLADGYVNDPELTAQKFIQSPFIKGERLYKTGDLARYFPDGNIEFLGRIDHQVKIRGFRIELGEIEAALGRHPGVGVSIVKAWGKGAGEKSLAAYVVLNKSAIVTASELKSFLKENLPEYMVPSAILFLPSLPVTSNGKLDREALPSPESFQEEKTDAPVILPRNQTEEILASLWCELLGRNKVGIFDNFFELGGHSLIATQILARVRDRFQIDVPLGALFEMPTIATLGVAIDRGEYRPRPIRAISKFQQMESDMDLMKQMSGLSDEEIGELLKEIQA